MLDTAIIGGGLCGVALAHHLSQNGDAFARTVMCDTATWMAAQAKVVVSYARPFWRDVGQLGNAFVTHEQAVVSEIFDACDLTVTSAALARDYLQTMLRDIAAAWQEFSLAANRLLLAKADRVRMRVIAPTA